MYMRSVPAPPPGLAVNVHQLHGQPENTVCVLPAQEGRRGGDISGEESLFTPPHHPPLTGMVNCLGEEWVIQMTCSDLCV